MYASPAHLYRAEHKKFVSSGYDCNTYSKSNHVKRIEREDNLCDFFYFIPDKKLLFIVGIPKGLIKGFGIKIELMNKSTLPILFCLTYKLGRCNESRKSLYMLKILSTWIKEHKKILTKYHFIFE